MTPQQIARDMIARDRRLAERQKVAPREKARRVLYRLYRDWRDCVPGGHGGGRGVRGGTGVAEVNYRTRRCEVCERLFSFKETRMAARDLWRCEECLKPKAIEPTALVRGALYAGPRINTRRRF